LAACAADVGEAHRGRKVHGAEIERRRRAVREQCIDERRIDTGRESGIGVARLERKRVFLQPILERQIEREPELRPLRRVHVQVDESGQEIRARAQRHQGPCGRMPRGRGRAIGSLGPENGRDPAVRIAFEQRVRETLEQTAARGVHSRREKRTRAGV
jgi:hypothetical protein